MLNSAIHTRNMARDLTPYAITLAICAIALLAAPPRAARYSAQTAIVTAAQGRISDPAHVGTISVGRPRDENATCDQCTAQACTDAYPILCPAVIPGAQVKGVTEPS